MISLFLTLALYGASAVAAPGPLKVTPLGKPDIKPSGTLTRTAWESEDFNPIHKADGYVTYIMEYTNEGLLYQNPETLEYQPQLAEKYEVSKDFLTYTFYIRKDATFSDGSPVTAEDVKFSIEAVRDPAYQAQHRVPYYEDVESIEVVSPLIVKIKMKKKYFQNLDVLATSGYTPIVSKKTYGDPKRKFPTHPLFGSGPYMVEEYNRGKNLMLVRNPSWWGKNYPDQAGFAKFERVNWRFVKEENLIVEMVEKGQVDFMEPIRAETFDKRAVGPAFESQVRKVQVENKKPKRWSFIGWNEKNPLFKELDVRKALSHLFNRKLVIEKFLMNKSVEAVGPHYYNSPYGAPGLKPIPYDPEQARKLLAKAGWADREKTGVLQKVIDGKKTEFRFSLLLANRDLEKWFTVYKEDLKKAGIEMEIKLIEWGSFVKAYEEQNFEALMMSWGGGAVEDDLKQIWHSDSTRKGGSNFISYSNKEVDRLIDAAREEMNAPKRKILWQKASKLIAEDVPYTFLFNSKYDLYLLNKRISFDRPTYQFDLPYLFFYPSPVN